MVKQNKIYKCNIDYFSSIYIFSKVLDKVIKIDYNKKKGEELKMKNKIQKSIIKCRKALHCIYTCSFISDAKAFINHKT